MVIGIFRRESSFIPIPLANMKSLMGVTAMKHFDK